MFVVPLIIEWVRLKKRKRKERGYLKANRHVGVCWYIRLIGKGWVAEGLRPVKGFVALTLTLVRYPSHTHKFLGNKVDMDSH